MGISRPCSQRQGGGYFDRSTSRIEGNNLWMTRRRLHTRANVMPTRFEPSWHENRACSLASPNRVSWNCGPAVWCLAATEATVVCFATDHSADRCFRGINRAQFSAAGCLRSYRGNSSPLVWPSAATKFPLHTILNRFSTSTFCCRCAFDIVSPFNSGCGGLPQLCAGWSRFLIVSPKLSNHRNSGGNRADKRETDREYGQHVISLVQSLVRKP